jgi:hypothetical protein
MSAADPEIQAEQYDLISSAAEELVDGYETQLLDLGHEIEAAGGRVVYEEVYADRTMELTDPESISRDLSVLVPVADQTGISVKNAVKAVVQDPSRGGREKIGEQVLDSPYVDQPGSTVVEYFQDIGGWTAEISYIKEGEQVKPEDEQAQRFVSEVENALDETKVEPEIIGWDE